MKNYDSIILENFEYKFRRYLYNNSIINGIKSDIMNIHSK